MTKARSVNFLRGYLRAGVDRQGRGAGEEAADGQAPEDGVPAELNFQVVDNLGGEGRPKVSPHIAPAQYRTYVAAAHFLLVGPHSRHAQVGCPGYNAESDCDGPSCRIPDTRDAR